jgi:cell division protein FtsB
MIRFISEAIVASFGNRRFVITLVLLALIWVSFLDSHSFVRRVRWHVQAREALQTNSRLRAEIERLREEIADGISDADIERIARTQYGMSRPGEVVYRIKPEPAH